MPTPSKISHRFSATIIVFCLFVIFILPLPTNAQFTQTLEYGDQGAEVTLLQKVLNAVGMTIAPKGPGSPGQETNYFGSLTASAVRFLQCAKGIICSGSPKTTGFGLVGPKTRSLLNSLLPTLKGFLSNLSPKVILPQVAGLKITDGLVAHYTFDDTANDSAGSNQGIISGSATYTEGKIERALYFDGIDDYASTGNFNIGSQNFTISAWLKKPSGSGDFHFLNQQDGGGNHWYLEIYNNKIYWHTAASGWVSGNNTVDSNMWNHIVVVGNDTNTSFYLNGLLDKIGAKSSDVSSNNTPLFIGYNSNYGNYFSGFLDDVRIYNRALEASEIAELYNYSGGGAIPPPSPNPINGQCGTAVNSCLPGTLLDTTDSATEYLWSCVGENGGSTAFCSLSKTAEPPASQNGVYNVKKDGTGHFTNIQACADVVKAGETCLVFAGTYNENIIPKRSGTAVSPISFATNGNVVVKGFWVKNQSYINISGFEIVEGGGYDNQGYLLSGVDLVSTHHINIINNYIHNITANGCINLERGNPSDNVVIKNNRISWCINYGGTQGRGIHINGNNNLVEGNDMSHTGSYVWVKGRRNVIRNNVWYENYISDFAAGDDHMDGVAYDCSPEFNKAESIKNVLIEGNFMHDSPDRDVKFILFRDSTSMSGCNPSDVVIRFNKVRDIGSYFALISENVKNFRIYNNTVMGVGKGNSDGLPWSTINMMTESPGGKIINNIFYDTTRPYGRIYSVDESSMPGFEGRNNLAYESVCGANCSWLDPINSEIGAVLSKNPQFLDTINFTISATSPAVDKGGSLTPVSSSDSGNGTQLRVNDAGMFQDGWAGVEPDWIVVGSVGNVSRIVSINYDTNIITLATPLTRSSGAPVYLYKDSSGRQVLYGSAPDIGAYEYNNGQPPPQPPTCTSFTYSAWSTCLSGQQTRTIFSSSPSGCTGGSPITTQSCVVTLDLDTTPPAVTLTAPTPGSLISGSISLSASASDPATSGQIVSGLAGVQFKLDNSNIGQELTTAPYSGNWNTSGVANGSHTLSAVARDLANNYATSTISIIIANTAIVTPPAPGNTGNGGGGGGEGTPLPVVPPANGTSTPPTVPSPTGSFTPTVPQEPINASFANYIQAQKALLKKIDPALVWRLSGKILLQVEDRGQAWYVDPISQNRFYLADGATAYGALRKFGLGITNENLAKIPVGIETRFIDTDSDGDGLPDKLEEGLGTDSANPDSDGDSFNDGAEISNGYNPLGEGKLVYDNKLVNRLKGRIVLQIESRGQAWYINPADGKRYYLKDGGAAYQIMRYLSLGITNENIQKIGMGD